MKNISSYCSLSKIYEFFILIQLFICPNLILSQQYQNINILKHKFEVPFDYYSGLIRIDIKLNGMKLQFIYDTGAEYTIITKQEIINILNIRTTKKIELIGADLSTTMNAYITEPVSIDLVHNSYIREKVTSENTVKFVNQYEIKETSQSVSRVLPVIALDKDIFATSELNSTISGIIGASYFDNNKVLIDYKKQKLVIYPYNKAPSLKDFTKMDCTFNGNKPILLSKVKVNPNDTSRLAKLMLDTGCSIPVLLLGTLDSKFKLPKVIKNGQLGIGLGGEMKGWVGLTNNINISGFDFSYVISKYQNIDTLMQDAKLTYRDGLLGNEVLKNFTIFIDNVNKLVFFKPNKNYKKVLSYDKSGLTLISAGPKLDQFYIKYILEDSPAFYAGLQENDRIIKIQNLSAKWWTLENILNMMKGKENKLIKLKVLRNGKKLNFSFRLKDMFR